MLSATPCMRKEFPGIMQGNFFRRKDAEKNDLRILLMVRGGDGNNRGLQPRGGRKKASRFLSGAGFVYERGAG